MSETVSITINPAPLVEASVALSLPRNRTADVLVVFRWLPVTELQRLSDAAKPQPKWGRLGRALVRVPVLRRLVPHKPGMAEVDVLMALIADMPHLVKEGGEPVPFSRESLETLLTYHRKAGRELGQAYSEAMAEDRIKN